ncbi:50S ribosomal protein L9 [Buchnera aphidicola (Eriosoma lanigerum)]|uniref:50S ribosomal protein L9 n=1 Tax=Buchnera aphidicola TaxID=9 RepID=UPI0034645E2D
MQVILLEKIDKLGKIGELIQVRSGYARNFLIPKGKAVIGTKKNIELFEIQRKKIELEKINQLSLAKIRADKVINLGLIHIYVKSGEEGKLFGSIGARDIANRISELGVLVKKSEIKLSSGLIRNIGIYEVIFQPHLEHTISIKINVSS